VSYGLGEVQLRDFGVRYINTGNSVRTKAGVTNSGSALIPDSLTAKWGNNTAIAATINEVNVINIATILNHQECSKLFSDAVVSVFRLVDHFTPQSIRSCCSAIKQVYQP